MTGALRHRAVRFGNSTGSTEMSETTENSKLDELTAQELDQVAGGEEQISFNFSRIEFKYKAQSAG
jgi:hypothetical protein